jgi:DNA-binding NtrC family response regulator
MNATVMTNSSCERRQVLPGMIGACSAMQGVARLVRRCAQRNMPTLIRGETGTGKELVAQALHRLGPRHRGPFVVVNAATLTDELGAGAIFGHVRGAYTGAEEARLGAMRRAHEGTLFIDEVASLTPRMQAMLLRVLEERQVRPVGGDQDVRVDVRIVSATCEPLERRVGSPFRADLYQRLATCVVELPPVRERVGDVPLLIEHLLHAEELHGYQVDHEAVALLCNEPLMGNVRELRNLLVQATLLSDDRQIRAPAMQRVLRTRRRPRRSAKLSTEEAQQLVVELGGNVSKAARRAGVARSTFRDLLRRAI